MIKPKTPAKSLQTVNGFIILLDGSTFPKARVHAYSILLRTEQLLGKATTDETGLYSISYDPALLAPQSAVFIRVKAKGMPEVQSPLHYRVPENLTIDLTIGDDVARTEYDRLVEIITPAAASGKLAIGALKEDDEFKDISFLAAGTGEDQQKIAGLAAAFRLSEETGIDPDFFYALSRQQFPAALPELLLVNRASISRAMEQAVKDNIVTEKWKAGSRKCWNSLTRWPRTRY